jgi:hypothetical protein
LVEIFPERDAVFGDGREAMLFNSPIDPLPYY